MAVKGLETFGIDIGGVIIDRVSEEGETEPIDSINDAGVAAVPGAFEAIARLGALRFRDRVWLISRCDEPREPVLLRWLDTHDFFASTGVAREQVLFCGSVTKRRRYAASFGLPTSSTIALRS